MTTAQDMQKQLELYRRIGIDIQVTVKKGASKKKYVVNGNAIHRRGDIYFTACLDDPDGVDFSIYEIINLKEVDTNPVTENELDSGLTEGQLRIQNFNKQNAQAA